MALREHQIDSEEASGRIPAWRRQAAVASTSPNQKQTGHSQTVDRITEQTMVSATCTPT